MTNSRSTHIIFLQHEEKQIKSSLERKLFKLLDYENIFFWKTLYILCQDIS